MLFRRLFLSFLVLIIAVTAAVAFVGADQLHQSEMESARESLRHEARLLAALLEADFRAGTVDAARVKALAPEGHRVTILAPDGRVLADTVADPATMDNHAKRPEIVDAAAAGEGASVRSSTTMHEELIYVAVRVDSRGFVRTAVPLARLREGLAALYAGLAITAVLALVAAGVLSFVFVRRMTQPIDELTALAGGLAQGDLTRRSRLREPGEIGALSAALNSMADSLAAMIAQAAKDRETLRAILSGMAEGVIATDRSQRILFVNQAAAALFSFDAASAPGKALLEVVRDERILKSREPGSFQVEAARGRLLHVSVAAWPEGLVMVARDVTEAVKYQDLRKEFVANVSHELRTPLTMIRGFVETLQDGAAGDPVKGPEYLSIIDKHVIQLTNLVNDLLELSRLEGRPGLPRRIEVDIAEVIRKAAEMQQPTAERKNQAVSVSLPPDLPKVPGDPDYLERAIANLVQNAIKYTPDGGAIRVTAAAVDQRVAVEVTDNGIGIPADDLPRIFERFYRVDKSRSRDQGGTGLGLSIVKHVVQAHGGTVEVRSEPGRGSTFRITLPTE